MSNSLQHDSLIDDLHGKGWLYSVEERRERYWMVAKQYELDVPSE